MNELLTPSWWVLALRGAVALLFGVVALMLPGLTLLWLVALYAVYAVFGGAVSLVGAVKTRNSDKGWWLMLLFGLVSIGAGVVAFLYPGLTALVLVLLMGANALITGVLDIAIAIRLRKFIQHEWLLMLAGVTSILFGGFCSLLPRRRCAGARLADRLLRNSDRRPAAHPCGPGAESGEKEGKCGQSSLSCA